MTHQELEKHLDQGEEWGFSKPPTNTDYLGWILITKRKPAPAGPFDPSTEPELHANWVSWAEEVRSTPYHVFIFDLKSDVYASGEDPENEDYRNRESFYVPTLGDVEEIVRRHGYTLDEIKSRAEISPP